MSQAPTQRNVSGLLGAFLACSVVAGLIGAGLALPAIAGSGLAASKGVDYFDSLPGDLKQPPLSEGSRIFDKNGKLIAEFFEENRTNVPLTDISPNMQQAVVAIEDSRFYQHGGVDPRGLMRAFVTNKISGEVEQGASTLTQQYVKNVLVESAYVAGDAAGVKAARAKNNSRKLKEIRYAVSLEKEMSKQEILNRYLNIAWFGGKIYGVQAAASYYFDTSAKKLSLAQSAMLAGMIQSPVQWDPVDEPDHATERRNIVLRRMLDLKMIDQATFDKTKVKTLVTHVTPPKNGCANASYNGYICDYIFRSIKQDDAFSALGKTEKDRENTLLRGGLSITTTLDPKIQKAAWNAVSKKIKPTDKSGVHSAAVTVQPGTGNILAMSQNNYWLDPDHKRASTTLNYSTDGDYGGSNGFQTGSTFKAFTLATWLKAGKSLNATVNASVKSRPYSSFKSCGSPVIGGTYTYGNAGDGEGGGAMRVTDATANSVNTAFVAMEQQLDLCNIAKVAESLGVRLAKPAAFCGEDKPSTDIPTCLPSLTLGVLDISPLRMAAAYAAFAAEGVYCKPRAITEIKDRDGKDLPVPAESCKRALSQDVARGVNLGLSRVLTNGTAAAVGPLPEGRPASGKTGTTNNSVATWFVGYTPQLATAVWTGDPKVQKGGTLKSLNFRTIGGQYYSRVYGATISAPIWKSIMTKASAGMKIEKFDQPSKKLLEAPKSNVPDVTGKSIAAAKAALEAAGFQVTIATPPVPSGVPVGQVASTSPSGGTSLENGSTVTISVSSGGGDPAGGNNGGGNGGGNTGGGNGGGLIGQLLGGVR